MTFLFTRDDAIKTSRSMSDPGIQFHSSSNSSSSTEQQSNEANGEKKCPGSVVVVGTKRASLTSEVQPGSAPFIVKTTREEPLSVEPLQAEWVSMEDPTPLEDNLNPVDSNLTLQINPTEALQGDQTGSESISSEHEFEMEKNFDFEREDEVHILERKRSLSGNL